MRAVDRRRFFAGSLALAGAVPLAGMARDAAQAASAASAAGAAAARPIMLAGNENPYGPGPKARAAIAAATADGCRYPMREAMALTEMLAAREGVEKDRIVLGSGSGELLHMLALAYCERGQIVCAWPTFSQLMALAERFGAEVRRVPLESSGLRHDLPALAAAITPNTSLVYVCNPNNPSGTVVDGASLRAFCEEASRSTLVVSDEAYLDFVEPGATASMVDLVRAGRNVVVLRTFSKIHGLAGLRVGYAVAPPDVAARLRRLQLVSPNILGIQAAIASLGDTAFLEDCRRRLLADRTRLCKTFDSLGVRYAPPQGNFVFAQVGMPAEEFAGRLRSDGLMVGRPFPPLSDWSRITIGTTAEMDVLLHALPRVFGKG